MSEAVRRFPTTRRRVNPLPFDGEDGLFYQSWYPVCLSEEVRPGSLVGRDFLDGKIVIFRAGNGEVAAVSAYCPHLGADLSVGCVVGDRVRCAFHHWEYDKGGACAKTGVGDTPPPTAKLFTFPTTERYGIVWVFNGEEPLWDLPAFEFPDDDLIIRTHISDEYDCDGWIFACNTPDMQHIKAVHGVTFKTNDPHELVDWHRDGFDYDISADHQGDISIEWRVGIRGTSFYWQRGTYNGWWLGGYAGFSCPRPGRHRAFYALAVKKRDGALTAEERLATAEAVLDRTVNEDRDILNTIHYAPGALTKGDKTLARYFQFLRTSPRAHPSAEFIR